MLVCATLSTLAHETAGAACTRHSLRPLPNEGENEMQSSDNSCRENVEVCLTDRATISLSSRRSPGRRLRVQPAQLIWRRPGESRDPLPQMPIASSTVSQMPRYGLGVRD